MALIVTTGSCGQYCILSSLCLNCTHLTEWKVVILRLQEVNVSGRDDAYQLATHFTVVCDGDATESVASLGLEDVPYVLIGAHHHRVCDEALLITLEEGGKKEEGEEKEGMGQGRVKGDEEKEQLCSTKRNNCLHSTSREQRMQGKINKFHLFQVESNKLRQLKGQHKQIRGNKVR